jgi:DNA-directed RNA polymerase
VWRAFRGITHDALAARVLAAGVTVCADGMLGADDDGERRYLNVALFLAHNTVSVRDRELAFKVGGWATDRLLELPIFELGDESVLQLVLTEELDAILDRALLQSIITHPLLTPSASPPEPWTGVRKGGVPADHWGRPPLIRDHHKDIEHVARKAIGTGQMRKLLAAIHALQSVPFAINMPVLHFLRRMPAPTVPPPPTDAMTPGQRWYHGKRHREAQARFTEHELIRLTAEALGERFWLPLSLDFRGRIYPIPHFNFTSDDRVRGLFLFADGKPIGKRGLRWLKAHVAARADGVTWSDHQVSRLAELTVKERIAWTEANSELLLKVGNAVLNCEDPAKWQWALPKDEPIQFVAACAELARCWDKPKSITYLPLTFDATCSGLQHLCAMTRDEVGGRYVNLTPQDCADDFYRRVVYKVYMTEWRRLAKECRTWCDAVRGVSAELLKRRLRDLTIDESIPFLIYRDRCGVSVELAKFKSFIDTTPATLPDPKRKNSYPVFLNDPHGMRIFNCRGASLKHPFDRKTVKRPAMSYFYGARPGGWVNGKPIGMVKQLVDEGVTANVKELAYAIYHAIEDMLPRPRGVRNWLERGARKAAKEGKPLRWTTPLGLTVINVYQPMHIERISTKIGGKRRRTNVVVGDLDDGIAGKAVNAITANFIHSADAAHMQLVALAAAREGIPLVGVHDCFGTLAPDAGMLMKIIHAELKKMHKRHNWLNDVWRSMSIEPFSDIGDLDMDHISPNAYR